MKEFTRHIKPGNVSVLYYYIRTREQDAVRVLYINIYIALEKDHTKQTPQTKTTFAAERVQPNTISHTSLSLASHVRWLHITLAGMTRNRNGQRNWKTTIE